jgi:hypothetical protein
MCRLLRLINNREVLTIASYSWDNREYPWVAPFHVCCRDILCKYIGIPASQLNYEVFFDALKGLAQRERNGRSLDLDYGEIKVSMRQRWKLSDEYFLFNPVQVKGLEDVFKSLPALNLGDIKTFYGTTGDSFVRLPSEVLLMVLSHIEDIGVVYELRKASPVFANMELDNNWWKRRIRQNMPWLWDLPIQQSDIDWRKAYQRVYWGSRPTSRKAIKIQGLCNRRRIWEQMCPYFSQEYLKKETRFKKVGFVGSPVINGIYARMMENLAAVKPSENILKTTESLLHNFDDLPCAKPSLVVEWSEDGFLVDLRILKARENETRMGDLGIKVTSTSIVELPKDDWLTGFIITSREFEPEEMKDGGFFTPSQVVGLNIVFVRSPAIKLGSDFGKISSISVKDGFFVVGLQVNRVAQGTVRGIGLFEQPLAKANGCSRVA